ncbi:MAG: hypothetical protein UX89_C0006G0004 [Parcubacteria group bacterium GW2011_GWA2_47_16]|nr:MAG: hypothetical protein UX89_C0006G0004 [Parcubacteria group bacterium GW2011_GWA2_47_16]
MDSESQKGQIGLSLKVITEIFRDCNADYRVLGSTLLVAHINKVFRHINDVDVLLDIKAKNCVFEKLKSRGFEFENKSATGFSWFEAKKNGCLGLTFLLIGKFNKDYFSWRFMKFFELKIKASYLRPVEYSFENVKFIGIPISSAMAGIRQSFLNPKRKLDKQVLEEEMKKTPVKTYNNISVYIFGLKLPYLYDLFSFFYNIYGGIRVVFGKKYEIWD